MKLVRPILTVALAIGLGVAAADGPVRLVVCAPGYPSDTEQAQATMDSFGGMVARRSGGPASSVSAVYDSDAASGIERIRSEPTALALVPLPFFLEHERTLGLTPILEAVTLEPPVERYSLVAARGRLDGPAALSGWEITGRAGYSPRFVAGVALGGWGRLPADAEITFTKRAVSALRKASRGEPVAVLLDAEQAAALQRLPFASELEVVVESGALPSSLLCTVGDRLDAARVEALTQGLLAAHRSKKDAEVLTEVRLSRFREVDAAALEEIRQRWAAYPTGD